MPLIPSLVHQLTPTSHNTNRAGLPAAVAAEPAAPGSPVADLPAPEIVVCGMNQGASL